MRILLDTNVLLWLVTGDRRADSVVSLVKDSSNEVFFSAASVWEIAVKNQIGKLPVDPAEAVEEFRRAGFDELAIRSAHAENLTEIPYLEMHKDPFDRMILFQAITENLTLITGDQKFRFYEFKNLMII